MTRSKTSFNLERKTRYLPMNAPIQGYWHGGKSRKRMALRLKKEGPYFRPPRKQEVGKKRAPMTAESGARWLRNLLCQAGEDVAATKKLGTHSLKATCLSSLAKWGSSYESRAVLGTVPDPGPTRWSSTAETTWPRTLGSCKRCAVRWPWGILRLTPQGRECSWVRPVPKRGRRSRIFCLTL